MERREQGELNLGRNLRQLRFLHVVKTGGTTIGMHLKACLGDGFITYNDKRKPQPGDEQAKIVSGHLHNLRFDGWDWDYMTVVREPAAWYASVFNQDARRRKLDPGSFWSWYEAGGPNSVLPQRGNRNRQSQYLFAMLGAQDIHDAERKLGSFAFITTTEFLDHDFAALCRELGLSMEIERRRVAGCWDEVDEAETPRAFCPSPIERLRLNEENPVDYRLWMYAVEERNSRWWYNTVVKRWYRDGR